MPNSAKKAACTCGATVALEAGRAGEPAALAADFDACLITQRKSGFSEASARKICGYIKAKTAEGERVTAEDAASALGLTARKLIAAGRVEVDGEARYIQCAVKPLDAKASYDRPKWIQVAAAGGYNGYGGGAFVLAKSDLQQMVDNFRAHPSYVPGAESASREQLERGDYDVIAFDWRHASEKAPSTPELQSAYAWALDLEVRDGDDGAELWALTRFLDRIKPLVSAGAIKSTSIAAWPEASDPVSGDSIGWYISSIAFTNDPFIQGMIPIAAEYYGGAASGPGDALCAVKRIFGLDELATLEEVMYSVLRLRSMAAAPPAGVDVEGLLGKLRVAFNMPALSSASDVLAETDKLLGALAAMVPQASPQETPTASYAEGVPTMNELKRLAARLGVGAEVITAARGPSDLEGPIFAELSKLEEFKRQACEALGVSMPAEAAAKIAELIRGGQLLAELMPKYQQIKLAEEKAEEQRVEQDVQLALSQRGLPTAAAPALRWLRKENPAQFAREYPIAPPQTAYLTQDIATPGGQSFRQPVVHSQHAPQQPVSPILRSLEAGERGVHFRQAALPEAGPGEGQAVIDLDAFPGRNRTEQAMAYLKVNGGAQLSFDELHESASKLLANLRRGGRAA